MDDFVPARKKKNRKNTVFVNSKTKQLERIGDIKFEICSSQFFKDTADTLKKILQEKGKRRNKQFPELVCYGLGNFAESYIARYQLGLLLAMREELQVLDGNCEIYDPKFSPEESSVLTELNFSLLEYNQEGKKECSSDTVTVFYMPHCGKALYNNLLWRNWGLQLENIVIIGNSFTHMIDRTPRRILQNTADYVIKIQSYTEEIPFVVPAQYEDVFNDTSIHTFPSKNLQTVPDDLWESSLEPVYDLNDAEIIFR